MVLDWPADPKISYPHLFVSKAEEEAAKPGARTAAKHRPVKAAEASEEAPAVPRRTTKPALKAAPAPAAADRTALALDARAAKLENENARLRQQLALAGGSPPVAVTDSATALQELAAGNLRIVSGARVRTLLSSQDAELRERLANSQAPFAVIITCSDSRLADNLIFDQELGRLFTIREAGNSPDTQSLASVEYALEHLGSKIVVVMGHLGCGAVKAVSDANVGNDHPLSPSGPRRAPASTNAAQTLSMIARHCQDDLGSLEQVLLRLISDA